MPENRIPAAQRRQSPQRRPQLPSEKRPRLLHACTVPAPRKARPQNLGQRTGRRRPPRSRSRRRHPLRRLRLPRPIHLRQQIHLHVRFVLPPFALACAARGPTRTAPEGLVPLDSLPSPAGGTGAGCQAARLCNTAAPRQKNGGAQRQRTEVFSFWWVGRFLFALLLHYLFSCGLYRDFTYKYFISLINLNLRPVNGPFFCFHKQHHWPAQFVLHSRNMHHFFRRFRLLYSFQFKTIIQ